jgi:hypothetical protein
MAAIVRWRTALSARRGLATAAGPAPEAQAQVWDADGADRYCAQLVRMADYEHYLCALLLPRPARTTVLALRAFNVELARTPDTARTPALALARLRFWRDTLDSVFLVRELWLLLATVVAHRRAPPRTGPPPTPWRWRWQGHAGDSRCPRAG